MTSIRHKHRAIVAAIVGLSTLRLSGVYFVIFTFGLTELIRQLVVWFEVNKSRVLGRYVFVDITQRDIYWQLMALTVAVFLLGWLIARSTPPSPRSPCLRSARRS